MPSPKGQSNSIHIHIGHLFNNLQSIDKRFILFCQSDASNIKLNHTYVRLISCQDQCCIQEVKKTTEQVETKEDNHWQYLIV